jgi:anti-anti-sigma regulatory factor
MLEHGHLAVYVADVAGHGVSAALLAVLFNQRLIAFNAQYRLRSPASILCDLNRGLLAECRASGLFVTAAYALIDTTDRTATMASAGHPPGILLRRAGLRQHLRKTGPALGLTPDASYAEHRIRLGEGDRLLLYTDGLTGAMSERSASLDALLAAVAGAEDGAKVVGRLLSWSGRSGGDDDDTTLLLLTAASGRSTFDDASCAATPTAAPANCALSVGLAEGATWVAVQGGATWKDAAVLRATCTEAIDSGRTVVVDLARCTSLDSTLLGTLHELVVRAESRRSLCIQGASQEILGLFEELAMRLVLSCVSPSVRPTPAGMRALRPEGDSAQHLVLHAHELLAELSAGNAEQFQPVIDALHREAAHP